MKRTHAQRNPWGRVCALFLAVALLSSLLCLPASAADSDFVIENGVLTEYIGADIDVIIPDGVTAIGEGAFAKNFSIQSVTIPEGVTTIGTIAFGACVSLTKVSLPNSLVSIGGGAFMESYSLPSIVLPKSITEIGDNAFAGCDALDNISIPSGVTTIEEQTFARCLSLSNISIPNSVTSIDESAFSDSPYVMICGASGSFAELYAKSQGIPFTADLPTTPVTADLSTTPASTAYARTQSIQVDGRDVSFQTYALKDSKGNETNYVKLRDIASVLNGTPVQFNVAWDGAVSIQSNTAYQPDGSELSTPFSGDQPYTTNTAAIKMDGAAADLEAIVLTDAKGGAYTYFQLRDLGMALGFDVDWNNKLGKIIISTSIEQLIFNELGIHLDDILITVDGEGIEAQRYFYWLAHFLYRNDMVTSDANSPIWDEPTKDGRTISETYKDAARQMLITDQIVEAECAEKGVTLSDEDLAEINRRMADDMKTSGAMDDEAFARVVMAGYCVDVETYRISRHTLDLLYDNLSEHLFGVPDCPEFRAYLQEIPANAVVETTPAYDSLSAKDFANLLFKSRYSVLLHR